MQEHLVQHGAEDISVSFMGYGVLDGLAYGASQGSVGSGECGKDPSSGLGCVRGRRSDFGAIGPHDLAAAGLLLVADLDHVDLEVKAEVCTAHGKGRSPLPCTGFRGDALESLLLGVVGLGDGGIQLVASGCVVAFELVIDMCGSSECFLKAVGPDRGRRSVHLVEVLDFLGNLDETCVVVQFLLHQLLAEDSLQLLCRHGLESAGVEKRCRLVLHVRTEVVP